MESGTASSLQGITARVTVQEAAALGWDRYIGRTGIVLGMHTFGMSAPIKLITEHFGFTTEKVAAATKQAIADCVQARAG